MPHPRSCRFSVVALVWGLIAACGGSEPSCPPTDATCASPSASLLVSTVIPADGANHVDPSGTVIVTFSRPVQPTSVTSTSITVGSAQGSLSVSGATVTFTPSAALALDADHQVRVNGVRAVDGTAMATAFTSSFRTRSAPVCRECPSTNFARADVEATGTVVNTAEGFTVAGSLSLKTGATTKITFVGADVDVRFDENGKLRSISGKVQIPSPHSRIAFADPVRADVGLFTGRFLNENRDLGILLKDDTDYFVFDFETALSMSIATGETGGGATKPVVVRDPASGGRILMVVDYRDPMYYVYGEQDLIGAAGTGWSLNDRIPFVPKLPVAGLGTFDGGSTRTGTFPFKKIMSISGQLVDNHQTELHLSQEDIFASDLGVGYQAGFNGAIALDLFLKDIAGIEIPIASASGGVRAVAGTATGFNGYAFARGMTSRDDTWWPAFIPARPVTELDVQSRVESNGNFQVFLGGEFGWELPAGRQSMSGSFDLTNEALTLTGAIKDGTVNLNITGVVTAPSTRVFIQPPPALLAAIHKTVNDQVLTQIAGAQKAYNDLVKATADYQFELSLRGIRQLIPGIVDVAKVALNNGITNALSGHVNQPYYSSLKTAIEESVKPYIVKLDALKAAALATQDNAATRTAIKSALETLAANKIFEMTYIHYILGVEVYRVPISYRIMSDATANQLIQAASYVQYIQPTSNIMISMQQIYNQIPAREIFEQVRDDITDGLLVMENIGELGFVVLHADALRSFNLYAVIGGRRYELGPIPGLTVDVLAGMLVQSMITSLRLN